MTLPVDSEGARLAGVLSALPPTSVLVVGDLILDRYADGDAQRISPEAPVLVFDFERDRYLLGGACNVAANLSVLGAQVSVLGVIGDDEPGERLRHQGAGRRYDAPDDPKDALRRQDAASPARRPRVTRPGRRRS